MGEKLPRVTAKQLLRALRRDGWVEDHQVGSHLALRHEGKPGRVVVPLHASKDIPMGTLANVLRQAGLSAEDLRRLLRG